MSAQKLVITLTLLGAACGTNKLNEAQASEIAALTLMPDCARGVAGLIDGDYDGLEGRDLAARYVVDQACNDAWWQRLEASSAFKCEYAIEYRLCRIEEIESGAQGLMVMPRDEDMLVLKRNGKVRDKNGDWQ